MEVNTRIGERDLGGDRRDGKCDLGGDEGDSEDNKEEFEADLRPGLTECEDPLGTWYNEEESKGIDEFKSEDVFGLDRVQHNEDGVLRSRGELDEFPIGGSPDGGKGRKEDDVYTSNAIVKNDNVDKVGHN